MGVDREGRQPSVPGALRSCPSLITVIVLEYGISPNPLEGLSLNFSLGGMKLRGAWGAWNTQNEFLFFHLSHKALPTSLF